MLVEGCSYDTERFDNIGYEAVKITLKQNSCMFTLSLMYRFIFYTLLLFTTSDAFACPMFQPLTEEEKAQAQSILIGSVIDYKSSIPPEPALITLKIENIVSGREIEGNITLNWIHGTFGEPETLSGFKTEYGELLKVGILFPDTFPEKCEMKNVRNGLGEELGEREFCSSLFIGSRKSKHPWILNRHCSGPYMYALESN
jgi:hypothetical protein